MGSTNKNIDLNCNQTLIYIVVQPKRDTITKTNNHINKRVLNIHVKKKGYNSTVDLLSWYSPLEVFKNGFMFSKKY